MSHRVSVLTERRPVLSMGSKYRVCDAVCSECLFSADRIVSPARQREIVQESLARDTMFLCHKGTVTGVDVACRGFYDAYPGVGQVRRIAERLGLIEFVPVPDPGYDFQPYREQHP
jgi:hypothetical protein